MNIDKLYELIEKAENKEISLDEVAAQIDSAIEPGSKTLAILEFDEWKA